MRYIFVLAILAVLSLEAQAYIGPGLGAGTLGVILGLFLSILVALFAIFWYPIKRMLKKKHKKADATNENE